MSEWREVSLGNFCSIGSSKRIFYSEYVESGVPFWRSKEVIVQHEGGLVDDPLFISEERYVELGKYGYPEEGDLLLTSVGTIGIPYLVKARDRFYFKDGNLTWFKNFSEELDSRYLYYFIESHIGQGRLNGLLIGSSQKALTISALNTLQIPLPPITTQKRIVEVLSAYDELIENSRKQIKLLEEAAQRLYKEWFIDFKFPGYETTPIDPETNLPEGWKRGKLKDVGVFSRGKVITKKEAIEGDVPVVAGGLKPAYYHNLANTLSPVITISASGNAGFVRMYYQEVWASDCSFLDRRNTDSLFFVFSFLKLSQDKLYSLQKGSAQQHVNSGQINELDLIIPAVHCLKAFENCVAPLFEQILLFEKQILLKNATLPRNNINKLEYVIH